MLQYMTAVQYVRMSIRKQPLPMNELVPTYVCLCGIRVMINRNMVPDGCEGTISISDLTLTFHRGKLSAQSSTV